MTEFRVFKELASEGQGMEDEVTMIAKNHIALVRTFEQKNLTEEVSRDFGVNHWAPESNYAYSRINSLIPMASTWSSKASAEST